MLARPLDGRRRRVPEYPYLRAFVYGLALSFLIFIPFMLYDHGYFLFYGDFNVQQIPFYTMVHDAIRSGNFFWSSTTDLGANMIGSYSFYLLGSPFFWLTLPFPSGAVPYLMGPLLMLKFGCASLTACIFLKRYVKSPQLAVLGGLLYAFSGFSVYNIFFNHFHEAIVIFPLLLWALDSFVLDKRRGVFALTVFASCFMNYYFFVGQVTFVVVYWAIRMLTRSYRMRVRDFLWLMAESLLGVLMACVILLPSIAAIVQNPRVSTKWDGWNALAYPNVQRYIHILQSWFFPPDLPARPNFTPDSNSKWSSLGAWLPMFGMTGVFAFFQRKRKHFLYFLLPLLALFAIVPILNSSFQLFNTSYYARWFYMLTLMMTLATVLSLEEETVSWKRAILGSAIATLAIALPIGLLPKTETKDGETTTTIGLEAYPDRFWAYVAIAMGSLLLLAILFTFFRKRQKLFYRLLIGGTALITATYGIYFVGLGKNHSDSTHGEIIPYALNQGADIDLPGDLQSCRSDFYKSMDNMGMYWQIPTIQAFHSIVPGSLMEFYPTVGVTRDVASRPDTNCYALRGLLSVRWLFDYDYDQDFFESEDGTMAMAGFRYYGTQNGYKIYENQYYIPMGFSYDGYYTREQYDKATESQRRLMLLKGVVLEEDDVQSLSPLLQPLDSTGALYTQTTYLDDCKQRAAMACRAFAYDNDGFTAAFDSEKERLVFFSVPYEEGWSAQVNGQPAEIYRVNVGFMAVKVPEGTAQIRFTYRTPKLALGAAVSAAGFSLFGLYCLGFTLVRRKQRGRGASV